MPKVICFANMKGGVGKTTLCVNLAFSLFRSNYKVLVVDNDPQFNATTALMKPKDYIEQILKDKKRKTIYDIYEKPPRVRGAKNAKLKPQQFFHGTWFMQRNTEIRLDLIPSRIELYETLKNPTSKEYLLDNFLKKYAQDYDYIFIDCPPTPSVLTTSAFAASDYVIIPVTPSYFSTIGIPQFLGTLDDFKEDLVDPHDIQPLGVVFTQVPRVLTPDTTKAITQVSEGLKGISADFSTFDAKLSKFKVYEKSIWQSVPVHRITGRGQRGKTLAMSELRAIASEMELEIHLKEHL